MRESLRILHGRYGSFRAVPKARENARFGLRESRLAVVGGWGIVVPLHPSFRIKVLMWGSHEKSRGATEPRGSALLSEVRTALAESEARSEERRLALESHMQDVGFMRIQLRVRNTRIAALEKEVSALGDALAHRKERSAGVKSDAASLKDTIAALNATLAQRDSRIAALEKEVSASGDALASRKEQIGKASSDAASLRDKIAALNGTLAQRDSRIATLEKEVSASVDALASRKEQVGKSSSDAASLRDTIAALNGTLAQRDSRIAALEKEVSALGSALASRKEQVGEANSDAASLKDTIATLTATVAERDTNIAALGKEVSALGRALARRKEQIGEANSDATSLKDTIATLTATVAERDTNIAALKAMQRAEGQTAAARQGAFARAIAETEVQRKNLATLQAALAAANARLSENEASALAALEVRNATEAALEEQRQRVARLEVEIAGVVRDRDASDEFAAALQAELLEQSARLATASARVLDLEAAALDPGHASSALDEEEPRINRARTRDPEADLPTAEDSTHRLEADPRELGPEDPAPLFIRTGESEVVHVLGRKTTIGRTPENDLQIDAQYISRHHAVILAERTHTIIEDLNSTNGVIVNGRRVMRQALKDGDIVLLGKAPFRFAMRPGTERR